MGKTITSEILVAYTECPHKAFLLMYTDIQGTPHDYFQIIQEQQHTNQQEYLKILELKNKKIQPFNELNLNNGHNFLVNAMLKADGFAANCAILTRVEGKSTFGQFHYEPTICIGTYRVNKSDKLILFFIGYVLEKLQKIFPTGGYIISAEGKSHRIRLENIDNQLNPFIERLQEWTKNPPIENPPPIILNKHCSMCEFHRQCRIQAERDDNPSLLAGVTARMIRQYEKKGIFTVKQLSYLFKPRKRRKQRRKPPTIIYKPELRALAIRTNKIYLQEMPELSRQPIELFLDIEGIPDQDFYYLIGLLICEADDVTTFAFWADTASDESQIWQQFLAIIKQYPSAPIYHYGSYEPRALAKLAKRYNTVSDKLLKRLINISHHVYGKIYFPIYSNSLKEIGTFIGMGWTSPDASGLQSIVWRHFWEKSHDVQYKENLLQYNAEDCRALKLLTDKISEIIQSVNSLSEVDFADNRKQQTSKAIQRVHGQFKAILQFASLGYDEKKISFQMGVEKRNTKRGGRRPRRIRPESSKVIQVEPNKICPKCSDETLQPISRIAKRLIADLVLTENGIQKIITKYMGNYAYCPRCYGHYFPPELRKYRSNQFYGHCFKAWVIYHRVALRMPYETIAEALEEQFNEKLHSGRIPDFMRQFARYYADTEELITTRLLESPIIHADETKINIKGSNWYAWVFTNEKYVFFRLRETREATFVHELLEDYVGILVTDFYPGYDSVACTQQKCWVHLIRDLNDDLRESPFDTEFGNFVLKIRDLLIPIMEVIQQYGLNRRKLHRFTQQVDKFYRTAIIDKHYKSDLVQIYQKRFIRYRNSLFTFLEYDNVPWHNNVAERAIRPLAIQRDMSTPFEEMTARSYLTMLSIQQTCKFQGKSFYKFLYSEEIDLDKFTPST